MLLLLGPFGSAHAPNPTKATGGEEGTHCHVGALKDDFAVGVVVVVVVVWRAVEEVLGGAGRLKAEVGEVGDLGRHGRWWRCWI